MKKTNNEEPQISNSIDYRPVGDSNGKLLLFAVPIIIVGYILMKAFGG